MLSSQLKLNLSYYSDLNDRIIPKNHILRKINDIVDFSFVYKELESKYCLNNGRCAKSPILLSLCDASLKNNVFQWRPCRGRGFLAHGVLNVRRVPRNNE